MASPSTSNDDVLQNVSVDVRICVGTAKPTIKELMALDVDTVLPLTAAVDDPVELFIGERLIARGYLEESEQEDGALAVRLSAIGDPASGLK